MTSRNWVKLFMTTLLIGGITTAIVGLIVRWDEFQPYFAAFRLKDIISTIVWLIVIGFLFSVISQMGFFAYLTVHRFGLGIFRSVWLWNGVQMVLVIFGLFDLIYLRYTNFSKPGESVVPYFIPALILLAIGLIVAWLKMKQTNQSGFIPALFVMVVVTLVEWVPVLRVNDNSWLYLMLFSLVACNAYQVLILHKLNIRSVEERQKREQSAVPQEKINNKNRKKPSR